MIRATSSSLGKKPVKQEYDDGNITYTFNNMLENEREFNIPYYISKWKDEQCSKNSQCIIQTITIFSKIYVWNFFETVFPDLEITRPTG